MSKASGFTEFEKAAMEWSRLNKQKEIQLAKDRPLRESERHVLSRNPKPHYRSHDDDTKQVYNSNHSRRYTRDDERESSRQRLSHDAEVDKYGRVIPDSKQPEKNNDKGREHRVRGRSRSRSHSSNRNQDRRLSSRSRSSKKDKKKKERHSRSRSRSRSRNRVSRSRNISRSRSRSRSRDREWGGKSKSSKDDFYKLRNYRRSNEEEEWVHDKFSKIESEPSPEREYITREGYKPPSPTWVSRAGGVAIMRKRIDDRKESENDYYDMR